MQANDWKCVTWQASQLRFSRRQLKKKWTDAQDQIESIKVLAMVERRTDDSKNPDFKNLLQVESWEVPVLEVVWSSVP